MVGKMAKKKIEPDTPATPDRQLESKSGWCITADHKQCPHQFSFGKCGCDCHKKGKKK
jgi:hypothetical protein